MHYELAKRSKFKQTVRTQAIGFTPKCILLSRDRSRLCDSLLIWRTSEPAKAPKDVFGDKSETLNCGASSLDTAENIDAAEVKMGK
jgi:hypothetical protein